MRLSGTFLHRYLHMGKLADIEIWNWAKMEETIAKADEDGFTFYFVGEKHCLMNITYHTAGRLLVWLYDTKLFLEAV